MNNMVVLQHDALNERGAFLFETSEKTKPGSGIKYLYTFKVIIIIKIVGIPSMLDLRNTFTSIKESN